MEIRQLQRAEPDLRGDSDHLRIPYGGDYSGLQTDACILLSYRMPGTVPAGDGSQVQFPVRYAGENSERTEPERGT